MEKGLTYFSMEEHSSSLASQWCLNGFLCKNSKVHLGCGSFMQGLEFQQDDEYALGRSVYVMLLNVLINCVIQANNFSVKLVWNVKVCAWLDVGGSLWMCSERAISHLTTVSSLSCFLSQNYLERQRPQMLCSWNGKAVLNERPSNWDDYSWELDVWLWLRKVGGDMAFSWGSSDIIFTMPVLCIGTLLLLTACKPTEHCS